MGLNFRSENERRAYEDAKKAYTALMAHYPLSTEDLEGEEWRTLEGYGGYYKVSNFGRVKSFQRQSVRILKPRFFGGYLMFNICAKFDGERIWAYLLAHRLVAKAFIPNPENKPEVNHIDGHKFNNTVANLEWATRSENQRHALATGLYIPKQGEARCNAKLTNEQVVLIRDNPDGLTIYELAEKFGVAFQTISMIQLDKKYRDAGGLIRQAKLHKYKPRVSDIIRNEIKAKYIKGDRQFGTRALSREYGLDTHTILRIINEE